MNNQNRKPTSAKNVPTKAIVSSLSLVLCLIASPGVKGCEAGTFIPLTMNIYSAVLMSPPQATECSRMPDLVWDFSRAPYSTMDRAQVGHRCAPGLFEVRLTSRFAASHSLQKIRSMRGWLWNNRATRQLMMCLLLSLETGSTNPSMPRRQIAVCAKTLRLGRVVWKMGISARSCPIEHFRTTCRISLTWDLGPAVVRSRYEQF